MPPPILHPSALPTPAQPSSPSLATAAAAAAVAAARLPIASCKADIISALRQHRVLVVLGETGSGKTTQLPQYLADCPELLRKDKNGTTLPIVVTQPRRVAAISVAQRVAEERGVRLGQEVGYHVRFDDCTLAGSTKIKYVTDGVLLRECLVDPTLAQYSVVVLDEAHVRSLQTVRGFARVPTTQV